MIEEVFADIFRMEIPLPGNPLKAINSYLVRNGSRSLIIDTGMNRPECREAMEACLRELAVDLERTDFFVTHMHSDHVGLVTQLERPSSKVYFNAPDAAAMRNPDPWSQMARFAGLNGFPEADLEAAIRRHPGYRFRSGVPRDFTLLKEKDTLRAGEYDFSCLETPGHTRGHTCLYEPRYKIFFSGDHILDSITPNISLWSEDLDPLDQFLNSLDKIDPYDIEHTFPGHRRPFGNPRRRISELKRHHEARNEEVISILHPGEKTAYEVAGEMTWEIDCRTWEEFPLPQKWFAGGEALAHLQYLQGKGRVRKEVRAGKFLYSLA